MRRARELRPDVITLDVAMPGMDGWSVLSALKADRELADIPVIMLTMIDDRNIGYALGAAEYMTKPVDRNRLGILLQKYGRLRHLPVLVVDDDPDTRDLLGSTLQKDGWRVQLAENGRVALQRITGDPYDTAQDGQRFLVRATPQQAAKPLTVIVNSNRAGFQTWGCGPSGALTRGWAAPFGSPSDSVGRRPVNMTYDAIGKSCIASTSNKRRGSIHRVNQHTAIGFGWGPG